VATFPACAGDWVWCVYEAHANLDSDLCGELDWWEQCGSFHYQAYAEAYSSELYGYFDSELAAL